jgi:hypothetical protein
MCMIYQIMCVNKPCEYVVGIGDILNYTTLLNRNKLFSVDKQENVFL